MKTTLLFLMMAIGLTTATAGDYDYLTFELTDGSKASVPVASLSVSISGTTLTANSLSFTLSNLSKMYFSASDESTGIRSLTTDELNKVTEVYDLNGRKVSKDQMHQGVYVVRSKSGNYKIAVK